MHRQIDVALGRDLTTGLRVAELGELAVGTYLVRVTLVDLADTEVLRRDVLVTVRETAGVTVLMTRDCLGVMCPLTGDDPTATVCLGGRCVEERCTPEAPEFCPAPECTTGSECADIISMCAMRACEDGTCFVRTDTATCGDAEYCDPTLGCSAVPNLGDGGTGDAGDGGTGDAALGLPMWVEDVYRNASNAGSDDSFGTAVSVSADGNTLAVGAYHEDSRATGLGGDEGDDLLMNPGAVYVFVRAGGVWTQQAYVKASSTGARDEFGGSVSLSRDGNTLAVGAPYEDSRAIGVGGGEGDNLKPNAGAVYIFARGGVT